MNQLLQIGFEACGHWRIAATKITCELTRFAQQKNILYAFVIDGELMYVGKTIQRLATRMAGYKNPGPTQTTNIRNNSRIRAELERGAVVEIFALPDTGLHRYGDFHLNLAAALEDDIIRVMRPPWNGGESPSLTAATPAASGLEELPVKREFEIQLAPTYFRQGFFNVPVAAESSFGTDGEKIELYLGTASQPILGTINRTANVNHTPRIMGGIDLRTWFHGTTKEGSPLRIEVFSPTSVRLSPK